jgi:hypothetical protein
MAGLPIVAITTPVAAEYDPGGTVMMQPLDGHAEYAELI